MILALVFLTSPRLQGQGDTLTEFKPKRFYTAAATGAVLYTAAVIGFNEAWYKDHERTGFHLFNDWGEWKNMDKFGHGFTAYFETELCHRAAIWTGLRPKKAIWTAAALGTLLQSTVEILDAYSARWGFSIYDMAYNLAGVGLYTAQELLWSEQMIRLKVSSTQRSYLSNQYGLGGSANLVAERANALFGSHFLERFLKDYNAQTIWISANPHRLFNAPSPRWLNIAIGIGSENLFGGFQNQWFIGDDTIFELPADDFPRYRQWYLAPDIDWTRIKTRSKWLNTAFRILNFFKLPSPAIEVNSLGKWHWHWLYF